MSRFPLLEGLIWCVVFLASLVTFVAVAAALLGRLL